MRWLGVRRVTNEDDFTETNSETGSVSYDLSELAESRETSDFGGKIYAAVTYSIAAILGGVILSDIVVSTYTLFISPDLTAISGEGVYSHEQANTILAIYTGSGLFGGVIGLIATYKAINTYAVKRKWVIIISVGLFAGLFVLFRILAVLL